MAKLSKEQLKGILKECIREIMQEEGVVFVSEGKTPKQSKSNVKQILMSGNKRKTRAMVDDDEEEEQRLSPQLEHAIRSASNAFGDSVFQEIFEDTARTTLQKQLAAEGKHADVPVSKEEMMKDENDLQSLAREGDTSNWAKLAFGKLD